MSTLGSAEEVRPAEFGAKANGEADPDMAAIAETIIERRSGAFDLASFRDRYQDALHELVEAKMKGLATTPRAITEPPKVINLMKALKRSLAQGAMLEPKRATASTRARRPFPTGVSERCSCRGQVVAGSRTKLLRSRGLDYTQGGGRKAG